MLAAKSIKRLADASRNPQALANTMVLWAALLPVQFVTDSFGSLAFVATADAVLVVAALLAARQLAVVRGTWTGWHTALLVLIPLSALRVAIGTGVLSDRVLVNKTLGILMLFAAYVLVVLVGRDIRTARRMIVAFIVTTVAANAVALLDHLTPIDIPLFNVRFAGARLTGMMFDPNAYGGLLVTVVVLLFAVMRAPWFPYRQSSSLVALASLIAGVILTSSRSAWVAFGLVLAVAAIFSPRLAARTVVVAGLAVLALVLVLSPSRRDEFVELATRGGQLEIRVEVARQAFDDFRSNPVFGVGVGEFKREHDIIVHNTPLWFLTEFGLVGFVVFMGFMLTIARDEP